MTARQTLRGLTKPAAVVYVVLALLTALVQLVRWPLALLTEIAEGLAEAGQIAQDHVTGRAVVVTAPQAPRTYYPAGSHRE